MNKKFLMTWQLGWVTSLPRRAKRTSGEDAQEAVADSLYPETRSSLLQSKACAVVWCSEALKNHFDEKEHLFPSGRG